MKKISLYISLLTSVFVMSSCTEDYNADVAAPQSWGQEEASQVSELTLTAAPDIDLESNTAESVQFVNFQISSIPEGSELDDVVIEVCTAEDATTTTINHTNGLVLAEDLQLLVEAYYGKSAEWRTFLVNSHTTLNVDGEAFYIASSSTTEVNILPKTPVVIPEYYIVGNVQGWSVDNKSIAFYPVDAEAGTLSITTSLADSDGNAYFKIFSGAQMGSWDNCYGTEVDGDTSLTGKLIDNGNAIQAPSSEIYTLSIDVISNTYEMVLADDQASTTYTAIGLIGAFNSWGADLALTEVAPHNWMVEGFVQEDDGELKFRANNDWAISWGAALNIGDVSYGVLAQNGDNLTVPAGTYNVYFNDITGQTYFIAQ